MPKIICKAFLKGWIRRATYIQPYFDPPYIHCPVDPPFNNSLAKFLKISCLVGECPKRSLDVKVMSESNLVYRILLEYNLSMEMLNEEKTKG